MARHPVVHYALAQSSAANSLALTDKVQLWQMWSLLLGADDICVLDLVHAAKSLCTACFALQAHVDIPT